MLFTLQMAFLNKENLLLAIVIYAPNPFLNRENILPAIFIYTTNPFLNKEKYPTGYCYLHYKSLLE